MVLSVLMIPVQAAVGGEDITTTITTNSWALRGGIALSATAFESYNTRTRPKNFHQGMSFASQIGYKWSDIELSIASYCTITETQAVYLQVGDSKIKVNEVHLLDATFGPKLRYYSSVPLFKQWVPYATLAWLQGLITLKFVGGEFSGPLVSPYHKLAYQSSGFLIGAGIESHKTANYNSDNPWTKFTNNFPEVFYEIVYKYLRGSKVSVVGGTKKEVKTLLTEDRNYWIKEHTFMLVVGMKIF
ncbi:MAG: hypothetical protein HQK53_18660 [Oligoflexia bacterium]|nr:hypothetical protein [Oligoflexia bacterium]